MYVIPDSVNTVEEAKEVMKEIDEVLGKWWIEGKGVDLFGEWGCSVLNRLFCSQRAVQLFTGFSIVVNDTERVLGKGWDPGSDMLRYDVKLNFSKKSRKVHSEPNLYAAVNPSENITNTGSPTAVSDLIHLWIAISSN